MNEMLGSECTSGCESGWTVYLEQSTYNSSYYTRANNEEERRVPAYDEEDESMVSDASSGPPVGGSLMFSRIDDHPALERENRGRSKKKNRAKQSKKGQENHASSLLDDTASSPIFNYYQNNYTAMNHQASMENSTLEYSQGFSATHFEGRPDQVYEPLSFYQPSLPATQMQQQNQWFGGKWG